MFDGVIGPAGKCGQILQRPSDAVERMQDHSTLIDALLFGRGPSTIIRAVTLFVVDAVKRVFGRWARSHIGKEILERVQPSLTHGDTSASVLLERLLSRACAAVNHVCPCSILWRVRHAVGGRAFHQLLASNASTRMRAREIVNLDGFFRATRAAHKGKWMRAVRAVTKYRQSSVRGADGKSRHDTILPYYGMELI